MDVEIYAFENTGESTLLTVQLGGKRIIARGDCHLRMEQGQVVGIKFDPQHVYLFDPVTGQQVSVREGNPSG